MKTKQKIAEALDEKGFTSVWKAVRYLNEIGLYATLNEFKWEVEANDGEFIRFKDNDELIEWAIKHRDKIKNES